MKTENVITVSISIPSDDSVEYDVMASDLLREVLHLMQGVFGEIDTDNAIADIDKIY